MLDLAFNNFAIYRKYGVGVFKKVIQKALEELEVRGKRIELSINLVGEGKIKALNKKYLGKNGATDVLSFPLDKKVSVKTAKGGIIALGDIFICLPMAKRDALKEGMGLSSKLALLAVHGLLHLLGYDHEKSKKERDKMFRSQKKILSKISF